MAAERTGGRWPIFRVAALLAVLSTSSPTALLGGPRQATAPADGVGQATGDPTGARPVEPRTSESRAQGWAIRLLAAYDQFRDDALIPLRWSGPAAGLSVGWGRASGPVRHAFSLTVPASFLHNRFDDPGYALGIEISYTFDHMVASDLAAGSAYLGLRAGWDLHDGFYESWDDEHIYWLNVYSVGPRALWSRPLGETTRISATLDVPLVAVVGRPPAQRLTKTDRLASPLFHLTEPHKDLTFATVWDYPATRVGLSLARRWGGSWLVITYGLERSSYDEPARVQTFSNRLEIGRHAVW